MAEPTRPVARRRIVDIDHGGRLLLVRLVPQSSEESRFRLEVIRHRLVKIEMVLGQVGENRDVPFESAGAILRERVRGDFHGRGFAAGIGHLREQFLKVERLRRGAGRRQNAIADFVANGPDQSAAQPGGFANVFE